MRLVSYNGKEYTFRYFRLKQLDGATIVKIGEDGYRYSLIAYLRDSTEGNRVEWERLAETYEVGVELSTFLIGALWSSGQEPLDLDAAAAMFYELTPLY